MIQQIFKNLRFREMVEENLKENVERDEQGNYTLTEEVFNKYFTITIAKNTEKASENIWELTNITYKNTDTGDENTSPFKDGVTFTFTPTAMADIKTLVNDNVVARKYDDGVMYYEARFKHFAGDEPTVNGTTKTPALNDLAPWNCWETTAGVKAPSSEKSYPNYDGDSESAERNYLGRYGMVRNNWYDVKVDKFLKPGLPVEPKTTFADGGGDTPDDHIDDYISVRIHVLSWAKRTQSWQF